MLHIYPIGGIYYMLQHRVQGTANLASRLIQTTSSWDDAHEVCPGLVLNPAASEKQVRVLPLELLLF